jgi:hypothetical protein
LTHQHLQMLRMRQLRRERRLAEHAAAPVTTDTLPCSSLVEATATTLSPPGPLASVLPSSTTTREPWRPGPDHPWRHSPIGKAKYHQRSRTPSARN